MRKETRIAFKAYTDQVAKLNNIEDASEKFTVEPSVQQKLEDRIQLSSAFLQKINIVGVPEMKGEKLGIGATSTIAGTTDTRTKKRIPVDPTDLDGNEYECAQINFDTALRYSKIDSWRKFPNFQTKLRDAIVQQQARDRIMIGWNGTSRALTSDRVANPKLQDVGKGWLQKYREKAPQRVMNRGANVNQVRVGTAAGHDYVNLDALAVDARSKLIAEEFADDTELVVILSRDLLDDKYFPIINKDNAPTEQVALDIVYSQKRVGNMPAVTVPFFPANTMMITRLDNLSIYWQEEARRRAIIDNPAQDQIENYESSNDDYVIEDYRAGCVVENITQAW